MSREVRRVPVDFDWPLHKRWEGYLMPDSVRLPHCPDCGGSGYSAAARRLRDLWYGRVPFRPEDNGSTPLTPDTPHVRAFAERNVRRAPEFYGTSEIAVWREARRLAGLWNGQWSKHLNAQDVAALVASRLLPRLDGEPTPERVNVWATEGFGHSSSSCHVVVKARLTREGGGSERCDGCGGSGQVGTAEQRAAYDAWERTDPPAGEGWQLWETTSEGSPVSPVFPTREGLVEWLTTGYAAVPAGHGRNLTREQAEAFVGAGWAPTFIDQGAGLRRGEESA